MRLARRMEWKQLQAGVPPSTRKVGVKLKEDKASSHTGLAFDPPLQSRRRKVAGLITIQRFAAIRHFKAGGAKLQASSPSSASLQSATSKQAVQSCRPHHHPALRCNPPLQSRRCKVAGLITIQRFAAIPDEGLQKGCISPPKGPST